MDGREQTISHASPDLQVRMKYALLVQFLVFFYSPLFLFKSLTTYRKNKLIFACISDCFSGYSMSPMTVTT